MKNLLITISIAILVAAGTTFAQDSLQVKNKKQLRGSNAAKASVNSAGQQGKGFVDLNGDGYNDNARDDDGDGIPNGLDPDYTGSKLRKGKGSRGFVDADGDGINDNLQDADGDGIPNGQDPDYVRPQDGTGRANGKGKGLNSGIKGSGIGTGTGTCDGTGPKGKGKGRK